MVGLYFIYIISLQTMIGLRAQDVRIVPFALMVWMIQPVVNSSIGLVLPSTVGRVPLEGDYPNFFTRVDVWFYVAIVVSLLLSWLLFDRRRKTLVDRFKNLPEMPVFKFRFVILLSQLAFAIVLSNLSHRNGWYCLIAFSFGVVISSLLASAHRDR